MIASEQIDSRYRQIIAQAAAPIMLAALNVALVDLRRARDHAAANGFETEALTLNDCICTVKAAIEKATGIKAPSRAALTTTEGQ